MRPPGNLALVMSWVTFDVQQGRGKHPCDGDEQSWGPRARDQSQDFVWDFMLVTQVLGPQFPHL